MMLNILLKWRNRLIAVMVDVIAISTAWFGAFYLLYDSHIFSLKTLEMMKEGFFPILFTQIILFGGLGLYRGLVHFASIPDLTRIVKATSLGVAILLGYSYFLKETILWPHMLPLTYGLLLIVTVAGSRVTFRWLKDYRRLFRASHRVLVVGAGNAGESLIRDLLRDNRYFYQPKILVDDDPAKIGRDIHGIRVKDNTVAIPVLVKKYHIELIFIAMPSASSADMRRVMSLCQKTLLPVRTLPSIRDLASGRVDINLLRAVSLEDLLDRDQVKMDWTSMSKEFRHKTILVTGGGGSIGAELCRQIALLQPAALIVIDKNEYNLYSIDRVLKENFPAVTIHSFLLDVVDKKGIQAVFEQYKPHMVFHAAAYKHVPLLENQLRVAVFNNIIGTATLVDVALAHQVSKFVLISTDKAVNPENVMGATKRAAEIICQNNYNCATQFITVRFGNVLDSAGSVVPLFRQQLQEGKPLTVTHPEVTRYFMSILEAAQLIIQGALLGKGGEIFVLDMGEPIKIRYLAEQLIKLAGKTLGRDSDIVYIGLRSGEKLHEELFYANEVLRQTTHDKILLATAKKVELPSLKSLLDELAQACYENDPVNLEALMYQLVPEYRVSCLENKLSEKLSIPLVPGEV